MIKPVLNVNNKLFCEQYWSKLLKKDKTQKTNTYLPYFWELTDLNQMFVGCDEQIYRWLYNFSDTNPNQMVKMIDMAFKKLPQTKENLTLWRGVKEPVLEKNANMPRFNKCFNAKSGDIIYMPEYAFASDNKVFSKEFSYRQNETRAILYEIEVPAGAKIAHVLHYVFPRCSKFECLETKETINNDITYHTIKLRYIKPEYKEEEPKTNIFKQIFSKINLF